ncbi:hypothetical protein [Hyphomicrobium sp. 99]|uniref:hypothetical protein n=1 Tax=Hyphomicrobium sp. 99 TaxID=1163419 RepID=UPI0005F7AA56|nr:hypothetical protein [Hyphomicrobium sp. 99]
MASAQRKVGIGHNQDPNDEIIDLAASCQFDPDRWSKVAWDWGHGDLEKHPGPREWQSDINRVIRDHLADPETRYQPLQIAVASGHGIGKSAEMGMLSNWAMSCWANAKVVITANTETQMRTKTSPEVGGWFKRSITGHWFDINSQSIKSRDPVATDSWRMDFVTWSEHNTEAFAGLHNQGKIILLLFDEASGIAPKVWEVAEGAMTDEDTVIIWVAFGNPTQNSGRFRECFRRFRDFWVTRNIDSRTVPGTNKKFFERLLKQYGEDSDVFKYRVRGLFPEQSAMQFISTADADAARNRHLRREQYSFAPVIIGVDPAWTGDDSLEIYMRQGLYSKHLRSIPRNDNDIQMANLIASLEDEYQADAVFIDAGYGTGIKSAGDVMGRSWRLIWFSGKAIDPGYLNKRAEMWGLMKLWLKQGGAIDPKDTELYDDIVGPETVPRTDGKIQLESKEDMKERLLPSPNKGDALALTFAEPVAKKVRLQEKTTANGESYHSVTTDYDPLE